MTITNAPLPPLELLPAGHRVPVGWGHSTVLPDMDFETFSAAGFEWDDAAEKYRPPRGAAKKGLPAVGSAVYMEHPSTEALCLAYDLKDGRGRRRWRPSDKACRVVHNKTEPFDVYIGRPGEWGNPFEIGPDGTRADVISKYRAWLLANPQQLSKVQLLAGKTLGCWCTPKPCHGDVLSEIAAWPWDLLQHLAQFDPSEPPSYSQAGLIEAHNSVFELRVWCEVLHKRHGWPAIDLRQMRCSMAKARAYAMPGALAQLGTVLRLDVQKDKRGDALIKRYCMPRDPTSKDPRHRIEPEPDCELYDYNETDIVTEAGASLRLPDLIPAELDYWLADQACNWRGVGVDVPGVQACIAVLEQAHRKYNAELYALTGGAVARASEVSKLTEWVYAQTGRRMDSADQEAVDAALAWPGLPPAVARALEIRSLIGSASVKKVYAMARMATRGARLCDLFIYHGARTGRDTHADVQPGNLPKAGPKLRWCESDGCARPYAMALDGCPWCGASSAFSRGPEDWSAEAVPYALEVMAPGNLELVELFFGDAVLTIAGCVRGLFVAKRRHRLICSDYSSIEAVVTAVLSGEQWRIDAFHRRDDIYLHGAASVTGRTFEWYMENGGKKHPDRQKVGKPAELGLGFGGWIGAWRQFDKSGAMPDDEVKAAIIKWREASPAIVELWGGQVRGKPWHPTSYELYGLEGMAVAAVQNPGRVFSYRGIEYQMLGEVLYCKLLSGRRLTYHEPRLVPVQKFDGVNTLELSFMGWNSNPKMGPIGWIRIGTYGGRLAENCIQATARDIMAHAVVNLERAGYPIVLRVHDELAAEVPDGQGSVEEFERIMATLPDWAAGWPIRAAGGWSGQRYRKE